MTTRAWTPGYQAEIAARFQNAISRSSLDVGRLSKAVPELDDIAIGTSRRMWAAPFFFDIANFSARVESNDDQVLESVLQMLHAVIPVVMSVIYDQDGYIEKNTGDGVFALFTRTSTEADVVQRALNAATSIRAVMEHLVNPHLRQRGIAPVSYRIAMDAGPIAVTRIGLPTGSAPHLRSFITAVGTSANVASKIEDITPAGQIWVGNNIAYYASAFEKQFLFETTPANWTWVFEGTTQRYRTYLYDAHWLSTAALAGNVAYRP